MNAEQTAVEYDQAFEVVEGILDTTLESHEENHQIPGYPSYANLIAQCLLNAEAQGKKTHGLQRLPDYVRSVLDGSVNPSSHIETTHVSDYHTILRGNMNFGQVTSQLALQKALDAMYLRGAPTYTVGARDMYHAGRLEWYVRQAVREGYVCQAMLNVGGPGRVAGYPDGTTERYGTNPFAMGVPDGGDGIVVDFATSAETEGFVNVHRKTGKQVPDGILQDHEGNPTNDPNVLYNEPRGTLLPMASRKGSGMAQLIDMQVDLLTGRIPGEPRAPKTNALVLTLQNPKCFQVGGLASVTELVQSTRDHIQQSQTVSGKPLKMPGQGGLERLAKAKETALQINSIIWQQVLELRDTLSSQ